jgi:hypothetical protein
VVLGSCHRSSRGRREGRRPVHAVAQDGPRFARGILVGPLALLVLGLFLPRVPVGCVVRRVVKHWGVIARSGSRASFRATAGSSLALFPRFPLFVCP